MMGQPKPFASLSSGLLARKGQAKPAMRPQGFSGFGAVSEAIDDLGWNDMGHNDSQPGPAPIDPMPLPPVLREREALKIEMATAASDPLSPSTMAVEPAQKRDPRPVRHPKRKRDGGTKDGASNRAKAAFTLRLNADRHLRLRLASALHHRSAQQLVTQALDVFLKTLPEVEAMASRLSPGSDIDAIDGG